MKVGDLVAKKRSYWNPDPSLTSIKYLNENENSGVILRTIQSTTSISHEVYWPHTGLTDLHEECNLILLSL